MAIRQHGEITASVPFGNSRFDHDDVERQHLSVEGLLDDASASIV
jgi:hypothetical protein